MPEFSNELRGVLFKVAEDKRTANGPVYVGNCEIRGQKYIMSAWINTSQKGAKYMSIRFRVDDGKNTRDKAKRDSQKPLENDGFDC